MIPRKDNSVLKAIKPLVTVPLKISDLFLTSLPVVKDSFLSAFRYRIIFVLFMCHSISFPLDTALSSWSGDPISITGFPIAFLLYGPYLSPLGLWETLYRLLFCFYSFNILIKPAKEGEIAIMLEQYNDIITIPELCEVLMIGRNRAYELLKTEQISAFQLGRNWKIPKIALEKYLKKQAKIQ